MASIWALAMKDLRILTRDKTATFFIAIFPLVYGVFFGVIQGNMGKSGGRSGISVRVVDEDRSEMSREFLAALKEKGGARLTDAADRGEAREAVRKTDAAAYLVIPKGFGETAGILWAEQKELELGIDPGRAAESGMLEGLIMQAMGGLIQDRFADPSAMRKQMEQSRADVDKADGLNAGQKLLLKGLFMAADRFMGSLEEDAVSEEHADVNVGMAPSSGVGVAPGDSDANTAEGGRATSGMPSMEPARIRRVDVAEQPTGPKAVFKKLRSVYEITFPSAILWGVAGCMGAFSISLVKEKSEGTLARLRIAPLTRTHILAGKALACFLSGLAVIVMMLVVGRLFFGVRLSNPPGLALAALSTLVCFVGLMMLISVLGRTEQAVGGAGWAIISGLAMLGGGMVPLAFLPDFIQTIGSVSPFKWAILALEGGIWRDFTMLELLRPCAVLVGMGVAAFGVGNAILLRRDM